jgi:hypothetical protein
VAHVTHRIPLTSIEAIHVQPLTHRRPKKHVIAIPPKYPPGCTQEQAMNECPFTCACGWTGVGVDYAAHRAANGQPHDRRGHGPAISLRRRL